jgi:hypothetical protein
MGLAFELAAVTPRPRPVPGHVRGRLASGRRADRARFSVARPQQHHGDREVLLPMGESETDKMEADIRRELGTAETPDEADCLGGPLAIGAKR